MFSSDDDSRLPSSGQDLEDLDDNNDHEVYKVTKDGVYKQDTNGDVENEEEELPEVTREDLYKGNVDIYDLNDYQGSREGAKMEIFCCSLCLWEMPNMSYQWHSTILWILLMIIV